MTCNNCARTTLSLFIRSFVNSEQLFAARRPILHPQQSRFLTDARRPRKASIIPTAEPPKADPEIEVEDALTMEGIRHLHSTQPDKFTTPVLAEHFKVSPEAIRRILKSKWRPSDEEYEARMERWNKRGERIWSNLVEMGIKPPKKWREMGVGRTENGEMPRWKSRNRNQVGVRDSINDNFKDYIPDEDLIPTVDKSGRSKPTTSRVPLSERL